MFSFSITGGLSNTGREGNTEVQTYINTEIQEGNTGKKERKGAGFPLLEAFPIRGREGYIAVSVE